MRFIVVALSVLAAGGVAAAQTILDIPDAFSASADDINARGDIVGTYTSPDGAHGFLLTHKGQFIPLIIPGAEVTAYGVNSRGDVVGTYRSEFFDFRGFVWTKRDGFRTLNKPDCTATILTDINSHGVIVGYCIETIDEPGRGFLYQDGTFTPLLAFGSDVEPAAIADNGTVVGWIPGPRQGFILNKGVFTLIDYPGALFTSLSGIASNGDVVGSAELPDLSVVYFVVRKGKIFDLPTAFRPNGINASGTIVGFSFEGNMPFVWRHWRPE